MALEKKITSIALCESSYRLIDEFVSLIFNIN